jgi:hypothetical protein
MALPARIGTSRGINEGGTTMTPSSAKAVQSDDPRRAAAHTKEQATTDHVSKRALVNGVNLHYIVAGAGPVVLGMHGWPQNHREFLPLLLPLTSPNQAL